MKGDTCAKMNQAGNWNPAACTGLKKSWYVLVGDAMTWEDKAAEVCTSPVPWIANGWGKQAFAEILVFK